jgi:hypothetical protein
MFPFYGRRRELQLLDCTVGLDPVRDRGSLAVYSGSNRPIQLQLRSSSRGIRITHIGNVGDADADVQVEWPHD